MRVGVNILYIVLGMLFTSCYNPNKHIEIRQENCLDSLVYISFFKRDNEIRKGVIAFKNKFILKNPHLKQVDIDFYYFRNRDTILFPDEVTLMTIDEKYFKKTGKNNRIKISPFGKIEAKYDVWNEIDDIDFTNKYYKSLEQYIPLTKPFITSNKMGASFVNKNSLIYEEPFSEFKRKNPELLEFLTKGDSIELEVVSPVKQKYKFKAEW